MNKNLIFFILFLVLVCVPLVYVLAEEEGNPLAPILERIVSAAYTIFGAFATVCYIYAGIMFAMSKGEAEKLSQAKSGLIWAVAGTVLGIISASIMPILKEWLGS